MDQWFLDRAREGNVYHSHNTTAGEVTVLSSTCTGLVLENRFDSGKMLVVAEMAFTGSTLAAIGEIGVAVSSKISETISTSATAAVIHNGRATGSNLDKGAGLSFSIATLASEPLWFRPLCSARVTNAKNALTPATVEFDGTLIVMPGTYVCFSALTTARTGLCSITWAEVDE